MWISVIVCCSSLSLLGSCAVDRNHTPDAVLERRFLERQADFEALLAEVQSDAGLKTIQPDTVIYGNRLFNVGDGNFSDLERLGMSRAKWDYYQAQLRKLGLAGGVLKGGGRVEFRVDPGSISNGDSYKGYEFRQTPPETVLSSLDTYRISNSDWNKFSGWLVYKRLNANWYIYLFVNG
jgi:hypothetical protein